MDESPILWKPNHGRTWRHAKKLFSPTLIILTLATGIVSACGNGASPTAAAPVPLTETLETADLLFHFAPSSHPRLVGTAIVVASWIERLLFQKGKDVSRAV